MKEYIKNVIYKNSLKENSTSDQIGKFGPLLMPLIQKIYPETFVNQIANVQPTTSPVAKMVAVYSVYTGQDSLLNQNIDLVGDISTNLVFQNQFLENTRLLCFNTDISSSLTLNSLITISNSGASAITQVKVLHWQVKSINTFDQVDPSTWSALSTPPSSAYPAGPTSSDMPYDKNTSTVTFVLVSNFDETKDYSNAYFSGNRLLMITKNRTSIKKYITTYCNVSAETNDDLKEINFIARSHTMECQTLKVKSSITLEKIQDIQNIYGEDYKDIVTSILSNEVKQEIDIKVINYLKSIATPMNDINLPYSLGIQASTLLDMSSDIVANINLAVEDIVRKTKRNRTMFVLCDMNTLGYLKVNPWHVKVEPTDDNPYRVGFIGPYDLYCDFYSSDNYVLVGYTYSSDEMGDAGLIFAPYTNEIYEAQSLTNKNLMLMNRFAFTRHPQDTGTGLADSDFFKTFSVGFTGKSAITPAGVYDLPNFTKNLINYI